MIKSYLPPTPSNIERIHFSIESAVCRSLKRILKLAVAVSGMTFVAELPVSIEAIATVEGGKINQKEWAEKFYNELYEGRFVSGGRVLAGAGDIYRIKTSTEKR